MWAAPAEYSLFRSADGSMALPYPAGWVALGEEKDTVTIASSFDALQLSLTEAYGELAPGDSLGIAALVPTSVLGLPPGTADAAALSRILNAMMNTADWKEELEEYGVTSSPFPATTVGGRTFAGVSFAGKLSGIYVAYELQPGTLVSLLYIHQGPRNLAAEQNVLWSASQVSAHGHAPALETR
ncbi:hypothetical protein ACFP81_14200 [Deinococcus lacus]|uniref:DUF1795 domain-containing protein n=1 Tax=Deinococcus lacus TaxID=392561 RepID=A0ABW1YG97_9DEIO